MLRLQGGANEPLTQPARQRFERLFGADFGGVRLHRDAAAHTVATAANASALTIGHDIYLGHRARSLDSSFGTRTLAHELAHVVQQTSPTAPSAAAVRTQPAGAAAELEAGRAAELASTGSFVSVAERCNVGVARQAITSPEREEARVAISDMWAVLSDIQNIGAEVSFDLWTSHGAITVAAWRRRVQGGAAGAPIAEAAFEASVRGWLQTFVGTSERHLPLVFRREARSWTLASARTEEPSATRPVPQEGRWVPGGVQTGLPGETFVGLSAFATALMPLLRVSPGGTAEQVAQIELDETQAGQLQVGSYQQSGGHGPNSLTAPPETASELIRALQPLTRGRGRRTARLVVRGVSQPDGRSRWTVTEAAIVRPAVPVPDEAYEIVAEYRATHQRIMREWRQGVQDAAVMAGMFGAEQIAFYLLGGLLARVLGAAFGALAPTLTRFIRGRAGVQYLETLIVRLAPAEKAELRAILTRVEMAGENALTAAERSRLSAIWARLEALVTSPLSDAEKAAVRAAMDARYATMSGPALAAFRAAGREFQIHHRLPLEYGHLLPGFDVNMGRNLIGLDVTVHRGVNAVWTRFRTLPPGRITPAAVRRVADIIDGHFGAWYNTPPNPSGLAALVEAAKDAARLQVDALLTTL